MTKSYLTTRIWKNAFSHALNENNQRLSVEYDAAWEKACSLAAKIKLDAPGLTLHDESHFEALWHDADMLVGDGFQLNAIEAFAFGMAILVHDAAHTSLAYQGGIEGLSKTPEWADNLASRLPEGGHNEALPTLGELPEELRRSVTLDTVRSLHAAQASAVLTQPFKHPSLGTEFFLIQDPTLRLHLGGIIGKIAASHHWDLAEVAKLPKLHHVTFPYSGLGGIRAQLLACLMRTSDAIQIDGSRAPDFEFALASPQGASRSHWSAQNRLAKGQDATDPTSLVINSTAPFPEPEANAWWLAYDLAGVADRELRNVDGFLKDAREPQLSITRVQNIVDPTSFANRVQTHGWYPVSAEIKVSDTAKIVDMLGGTGLYGPDNHVPLREILQNAIDAVIGAHILIADR